jgi:hypothetical protein
MTITSANLKWYQCLNWTDAATHGGDINTTATITTNTSQNIFDNVSDAERTAGLTDYRKIYFRNENDQIYTGAYAWIGTNTPAANDAVWVCAAGTMSQTGTAIALNGTATWTNASTVVLTSADLTYQVRPGERIYNSTDDAYTLSATVYSVVATQILLSATYGGTTGSAKAISVASANTFTYAQPASKGDTGVISMGDVASTSGYYGIWVKRVVAAGCSGYTNNSFEIDVENS